MYDCAIIHISIIEILQNKNDAGMNNPPDINLDIANTCENCKTVQNIDLGHTTIKADQSQYFTNQ